MRCERVVLRAMDRDPDKRFRDAQPRTADCRDVDHEPGEVRSGVLGSFDGCWP